MHNNCYINDKSTSKIIQNMLAFNDMFIHPLMGSLVVLSSLILITLQWFLVLLALDLERTISERVLLIIAHPDDEVMFFGPTISSCKDIFILCLSEGLPNATIRRQEFFNSCRVLGIEGRCVFPEKPFIDGFDQVWDREEIQRVVKDAVLKYNPEIIITFDLEGVSLHPNHIAIPAALTPEISTFRYGNLEQRADESISYQNLTEPKFSTFSDEETINMPIYVLKTNRLLKYTSFFGMIKMLLLSKNRAERFLASSKAIMHETYFKAFREYHSQKTWYRYTWFYLSQYVFYNQLELKPLYSFY